MLPNLLNHAPLLLGVGHLARLLRVEAQLCERAAHVRHVLPARCGEVLKIAVRTNPALAAPVSPSALEPHPEVRGLHV